MFRRDSSPQGVQPLLQPAMLTYWAGPDHCGDCWYLNNISSLFSITANISTRDCVVGDIAHAVQVEALVEPMVSAEVHLGVVNMVHDDELGILPL